MGRPCAGPIEEVLTFFVDYLNVLAQPYRPYSVPGSGRSRRWRATRAALRLGSIAALVLSLPALATDAASGSVVLSDAEIELILRKGKILRIRDIGVGVTQPRKLEIELDGVTLEAALKTVDERVALARFDDGTTETNFTDSYLYERAAYLLDRHLGLNMVPVAVIRRVRRFNGAVIAWVDGAVIETERRAQKLNPPDPTFLEHQRDVMHIFDALIANTDRNAGNQLTTPADWKLHLIDHSRSFRRTTDLPENFLNRKYTLPREVYDRISLLSTADLKPLFKKLLGSPTIKALLIRRDKIIEKIDRDRQKWGDETIFQDAIPSLP